MRAAKMSKRAKKVPSRESGAVQKFNCSCNSTTSPAPGPLVSLWVVSSKELVTEGKDVISDGLQGLLNLVGELETEEI